MAKKSDKKKSRPQAGGKTGMADVIEDAGRGKKPKGVAAVGYLKSQGTRAFRKGRTGS
jgi:hypothetical protein